MRRLLQREDKQQKNRMTGLGSFLPSEAAQHPVICCVRQRRVVVVGGRGGSEDRLWKHQTYLPCEHFALLGTYDVSSDRSDPLNQSTSGPSAYDWSLLKFTAISPYSIWPSTASCAPATWSACNWSTLWHLVRSKSARRFCRARHRSRFGLRYRKGLVRQSRSGRKMR